MATALGLEEQDRRLEETKPDTLKKGSELLFSVCPCSQGWGGLRAGSWDSAAGYSCYSRKALQLPGRAGYCWGQNMDRRWQETASACPSRLALPFSLFP